MVKSCHRAKGGSPALKPSAVHLLANGLCSPNCSWLLPSCRENSESVFSPMAGSSRVCASRQPRTVVGSHWALLRQWWAWQTRGRQAGTLPRATAGQSVKQPLGPAQSFSGLPASRIKTRSASPSAVANLGPCYCPSLTVKRTRKSTRDEMSPTSYRKTHQIIYVVGFTFTPQVQKGRRLSSRK